MTSAAGVRSLPRASAHARGGRGGLASSWPTIAVQAGRAAAALSRAVGRGEGSIIGGRVTLTLFPRALHWLAAGRRVVLVSGTNGKTTTSHLLAAALRVRQVVAHNATGSNMADGAVAALTQCPRAEAAVLEVDELHLASVAPACAPAAVVLLNLTRDQLDRSAEVRRTAASIGASLAELPLTTVFANVDDPMTVWAATMATGPVVWVAAGSSWSGDSANCPACGQILTFAASGVTGGWSCACGLRRPRPSWWLAGSAARSAEGETALSSALPGEVNLGNALFALAVAGNEGVPLERASAAISAVDRIGSRYASDRRGPHIVRSLLAKNPAGWAATLAMLTEPRPIVIAVNAREADGRDTSWLWDVDFAGLRGRRVVASGEHAADLGVRLSYAEVEHSCVRDPLAALDTLPPGEVDVVGNYTAFLSLTRRLTAERSRR